MLLPDDRSIKLLHRNNIVSTVFHGVSNRQLITVLDAIIFYLALGMLYQHGVDFYPRSLKAALMLSCVVCYHLVFVCSSINQHIYLNITATVAGFKKHTHISCIMLGI